MEMYGVCIKNDIVIYVPINNVQSLLKQRHQIKYGFYGLYVL